MRLLNAGAYDILDCLQVTVFLPPLNENSLRLRGRLEATFCLIFFDTNATGRFKTSSRSLQSSTRRETAPKSRHISFPHQFFSVEVRGIGSYSQNIQLEHHYAFGYSLVAEFHQVPQFNDHASLYTWRISRLLGFLRVILVCQTVATDILIPIN